MAVVTLGCFNVLHEQNVPLIAHCFGLDIEKKLSQIRDWQKVTTGTSNWRGNDLWNIFLESFVSYEIDIFKVKILNITFKNI